MDHVDARTVAFGCVDQLQRYSSNVMDFHSVSHAMGSHSVSQADYNAVGNCGHIMLSQGTTNGSNCDPLSAMHDFSMTPASCGVPLGLASLHSGSGDLSSMLALSSGLQPVAGAFAHPHANPSSSMYPYLPAGGMQSFLQAASPVQFPFQNFPTIRGSFTNGLNPTTARPFSCFRPVSVSDSSLLLSNSESTQTHLSNYSQPGCMSFMDGINSMHTDSMGRQPPAARLLVNSGLSVDQTVLNISTFLNLPSSAAPALSLESRSSSDHSVLGTPGTARSDNLVKVPVHNVGSSVASDNQTSSSSFIDKVSPSGRRRRTVVKGTRTNGTCIASTPAINNTAFETSASCVTSQTMAAHTTLNSDCMPSTGESSRMHLDSFVFSTSVADAISSSEYGAHKVLMHSSDFESDLHDLDGDDMKVDLLTLPETEATDNNHLLNGDVNIEEHQCVIIDGVRRWRCLECPKVYSTKHNLVTHTLGHRGIKPHRCLTCGKYFKQISHLQTHALTHASVKPHTCTVCSRGFTQASHVKRHMAVHMEPRMHNCTYCQRSFAFPSELRSHIHKLHKQSENAGNSPLTCKLCDSTFDSCEALRSHRLQAHRCRDQRVLVNTSGGAVSAGSLTCNICSKVFTYPSQLRDHAMKHEGRRPFMCTECGMDFMKEHHLKAHQFTHTGLRPYVCQVCGRAFNQKANLQRHQLVHDGDRKFACEVCGRGFTQMQVLRAHLVTHQETKPFQCKVCGKGFTRLHNLNGHLHMHDGDKPFVCSCGASFTLKGNLNRHKKDKHRHRDEQTVESTTNDDVAACSSEEPLVAKKKKRKSMPPRKTVISTSVNDDDDDDDVGNDLDDDGEVTAAWQLNDDEDDCEEDDDDDEEYDDDDVPVRLLGCENKINQSNISHLHGLLSDNADEEQRKRNGNEGNLHPDSNVLLENSELRTFSNLTAVSSFSFDGGMHQATADDDMGSWQLTDCVPVKTEDLSQMDGDLTRIASNSSLSVGSLSRGANIFKITDTGSYSGVIPLEVDDDDNASTPVECYGVSVSRHGGAVNEDLQTDSANVQVALSRQPRTARIGKAASLAVLMASHVDSAKCDSA